MTTTARIEIDIDVYRRIEGARVAFGESQNAILRRLLGIDPRPAAPARPVPRTPRSSGAYSTMLGATPVEANSLKELLRRAILIADRQHPGLLDRLGRCATPKGRRIVAKSPEALYPRSPHLIAYAEPLDGTWWLDSNIGRNQAAAYLWQVARLAGAAQRPVISKRSEKTAVTAADLGL